ncbi:MAG: bis(5'-nucleosyl)-tetraphosphatase [Pyrobaculum sp.]
MYDEISAGAVVFYRGETVEYLLLHYPAGHWDFPKGNVEPGETLEEAALREIREETGLEVKLIEGFREEVEYVYRRGGKSVRKKVYFFLAEAFSKEVRLSWEHVDYLWLPYEKALAKVTYDSSRRVLAKARRFLQP